MIDKRTINPYDPMTYNNTTTKIIHEGKEKESLNDYLFTYEITGDNINKKLLFGAGYLGQNVSPENSFILSIEDIDNIITKLNEAKIRLEKGKKAEEELKRLHGILDEYLNAGYIESITIIHKNDLPPYYAKSLYDAFIIRPDFKKGIQFPPEVNTGFNFIEVLHMDINEQEFDKTMNYIRHWHDIPIHFVGFDIYDKIRKRQKEALADLDKRIKDEKSGKIDQDRKKYLKKLEELGIPLNILNTKK